MPLVRTVGVGLAVASIGSDIMEGYAEGGIEGASIAGAYGGVDAGVDYALLMFGPVGLALAVGFAEAGGSRTDATALAFDGAMEMCNAMAGVPTSPLL
jgi:hypothetical protein